MNLAEMYAAQERERRHYSFRGLRFTEDQRKMYDALRERIVNNDPYVFHPMELGATRRSGKTTVLLKLAEEFNLPLITHSSVIAQDLSRRYEGIRVVGSSSAERLRGMGRYALIDEIANFDYARLYTQIITGINDRRGLYGY